MRISDWSSDVCSSDLGIGDIRPQPFADRHEPLALSMYLHVVLIVSGLYIDRDGDRPARACDQPGDDFIGDDRIAVQNDEVSVNSFSRDPASTQIVRHLEQRIEDCLNLNAIHSGKKIIYPLRASIGHKGD